MPRPTWSMILATAIVLAADAKGNEPPVGQVKSLLQGYTEGFFSPATDLAYGARINGPRGIGVLESPEEIARGRVRGVDKPWGYGAGIEDLAYHNGMLLYALCDAEEATGEMEFAQLASRVLRGLRRMSTLSPVPGFVPRGPHPDGKSYYRDSSFDQHSLYVCGLWRFFRSRLASPEDKQWIGDVIGQVVGRLEKSGWSVQTEDGSVAAHAGGSMLRGEPVCAALLLMMLSAAHDATGDSHWRQEYERFGSENNEKRWGLLAREIDRSREPRWTMFFNQDVFRLETLRRIETAPDRKAIVRGRIERMAGDMLSCSYFRCWRRESATPVADEETNATLKPLGVTVDANVTVMDLWQKYLSMRPSPDTPLGRIRRCEPVGFITPAMVWHIALVSQKPEYTRPVQSAVRDMLKQVDFRRIENGWTYNYAVLAALWSIASPR